MMFDIIPMKVNSEIFSYQGERGSTYQVFQESRLVEEDVFTNLFPDLKKFFLESLPRMKKHVQKYVDHDMELKVFLCSDLGTLFLASHLADIQRAFHLVVATPADLGGKTEYARVHPLMMNKLITRSLQHAKTVTIRGEVHFEKLPKAFPRIKRKYLLEKEVLKEES